MIKNGQSCVMQLCFYVILKSKVEKDTKKVQNG